MAATNIRIEEDALGHVEVPADHLWGAQTQRSLLNFPIAVALYHSGRPVVRAAPAGRIPIAPLPPPSARATTLET